MSASPAIDWSLCLKLALNKEDIAREMLDRIVASLPQEKQGLQQAYQQQDHDNLCKLAHKLHGACCYSGLPSLKIAAKNLEIAITNKVVHEYENLYHQLIAAIDNVVVAYDENGIPSANSEQFD